MKTVTLTFKFSVDKNLIDELYNGDLECFGNAMENLMDSFVAKWKKKVQMSKEIGIKKSKVGRAGLTI